MLEIVDNPGLDNLIIWCNGYKQRNVCKKKTDKELMPGAQNPLRSWDWCIPEDEKKVAQKFFDQQLFARVLENYFLKIFVFVKYKVCFRGFCFLVKHKKVF